MAPTTRQTSGGLAELAEEFDKVKVSGKPVEYRRSGANPAALRESCCWPGCGFKRHDAPDAPPVCTNHMVEAAHYIAEQMGIYLLDPSVDGFKYQAHRQETKRRVDNAVVYYIRIGDHVKIGTTIDLRARMSSLCVDHSPDTLLAVEPGGTQLERQRHREFAAERVNPRREMFNPSPRLLAHIAALPDFTPDHPGFRTAA